MTAYQPAPGVLDACEAHDAYDAVVLAGGSARRLGGADKPGVRVGGRALLERVLSACAGAAATVVVAAPRPTARPVRWVREDPPGGGPVAALDAGLRATTAPVVLVLSADLPFLDPVTVTRLTSALAASGAEGVLLRDAEGRDQPLVAAYRAEALRRALDQLAAEHGGTTERAQQAGPGGRGAQRGLAGLSLRRLTGELRLTRAEAPSRPSTATPGTTSPPPEHGSGSMSTCWMNGSPQSRTNWASNSTSTPASCSTSPVTPRTTWPGRRPR